MLSAQQREQYARQISLTEMGEEGQQKLLQSKVLVIGAGGLGCPVLQYLTAAGIGCIGIVDDDTISLNNLHRQILYGVQDVGKLKALVAAERLQQINPNTRIQAFTERLTCKNIWDVATGYDIIIDGSDNFATRYLVNEVCVLQNKPLIHGSIYKFEGQVAVFNVGENAVNYRDIFPAEVAQIETPNCSVVGVMGVLPGIIGCMMANETIKLITGLGTVSKNKLLVFDALKNSLMEIEILPNKNTFNQLPKTRNELEQMVYDISCDNNFSEIDSMEFDQLLSEKNVLALDVRELNEMPLVTEFAHIQLPLSKLRMGITIDLSESIVVFCQTGVRSKAALSLLLETNPSTTKIHSLKGGIMAWKNHHQKLKS